MLWKAIPSQGGSSSARTSVNFLISCLPRSLYPAAPELFFPNRPPSRHLWLILGGAGPPREVMTGAMRAIGDFTPLRYVILILQDPWLGFGWHEQASLITAGVLVVAGALSARFFRWE